MLGRSANSNLSLTDHIALTDDKNKMASKKSAGTLPLAAALDDKDQLARIRSLCGAFPGIIEKLSHGAPTFFTPKRVFVMFVNNHHNDGHLAIWIPAAPGVQEALIDEAPGVYFRPPYVGVSGWVGVELAKVDDEQLGVLIREAFRFVGKKAASKARNPVPGV